MPYTNQPQVQSAAHKKKNFKMLIELEDANHRALDKGTVTFVVPAKFAAEKHP